MFACTILILVLADFKSTSQLVNAELNSSVAFSVITNKHKRQIEDDSCFIPEPLENGFFYPHKRRCPAGVTSSPACHLVPWTSVEPQWVIFYNCDPGFQLSTTKSASICLRGQWTPALPSCVESTYTSGSLPAKDVCGKPAPLVRTKRRTYGKISKKGEWPWLVIFGHRKSQDIKDGFHWFCAGTLVTTRHILTAAHCVADYRRRPTFVARIGDINLNDSLKDGVKPMEITIQKNNIIVYPAFHRQEVFSHNIAIVKLASDIIITDFVRPICLPTPDFKRRSFTDETAYFVSYGQTDNDRDSSHKSRRRFEPVLHEISATVKDHNVCNDNYKNYQSDDFVIISDELICASVEVNRSCQGDAGSPLMLKVKDRYFLIGIVATEYRCYDETFPRLFTKLAVYMDWIVANLKF